jgi:hypothetical protein
MLAVRPCRCARYRGRPARWQSLQQSSSARGSRTWQVRNAGRVARTNRVPTEGPLWPLPPLTQFTFATRENRYASLGEATSSGILERDPV